MNTLDIDKLIETIQKQEGARSLLKSEIDTLGKEIEAGKKDLETVQSSQLLIQGVAQATQEFLRYRVEDIVQSALETTFGDGYYFNMDFVSKRGKTEGRFYLTDDQNNEMNIIDSSGGGLADLISFALRIAVWSLENSIKDCSPLLVLDEPFKWLSAGLRPLAASIVKELSEKLGLQILMVTHDPVFSDIGDQVVSIEKGKDGRSRVKEEAHG